MAIDRAYCNHFRLTRSNRPGFVQRHSAHPAQLFQKGTALKEHPMPRPIRDGANQTDRCADHQRAGTSHHQQRQPTVEPAKGLCIGIPEGLTKEDRRDQRDDGRNDHHGRRVPTRKLINKTLHWCPPFLRLFYQPDHTADRVVGG